MFTQLAANTLTASATFVLMAVGFWLINSTTRHFDMTYGALFMIGAYIACVSARIGVFPIVCVSAGVIAAVIVGVSLYLSLYCVLQRRGAKPAHLFLASLGMLVVIQNIIAVIFGDGAVVYPSRQSYALYSIADAYVTNHQLQRMLFAVAVCLAVGIVLRITRVGRQLRAVAEDPELARTIGIDTHRMTLAAAAAASALAGAAGAMFVLDMSVRPETGTNVFFISIAPVVLASRWGSQAVAAATVLVVAMRTIAVLVGPAQWADALVYALVFGYAVLTLKK